MKTLALLLFILTTFTGFSQTAGHETMQHPDTASPEQLGAVSFAVSCSPSVQAQFNRGVALLHDFWYEEALTQFQQIAKTDPNCAMAHWGVAISQFHQIWDRPDAKAVAQGGPEMQKAQSLSAKTDREREYIAAPGGFYKPGKEDFQTRIDAYSAAMGKLYSEYPDDVDAGALYALSMLAATKP